MKTLGIIAFIGLLAITMNCATTETAVISDTSASPSQEIDSLDLARKNRVDSVAQIKKPATVNSQTILGAPKVVKKRSNDF